MPKRQQREEEIDYEPTLRMPKADVILKVCDKIKAIADLMQKTRKSMEFSMWLRETETLLIHAFGPKSRQVHDFKAISYYPPIISFGPYDDNRDTDYQTFYLSGLQTARECLLAIMTEVKDFYPDEPEPAPVDVNAKTFEQRGGSNAGSNSRKVFVVHGHDEGMKSSVARFLEKLDLQPIILHEQPNGGKTIIEKFEANADVAFAVVLVSPDDEGREKVKKKDDEELSLLKNRARQNVILELGYFIGRLGRARVCALQSDEIDTPTDILGVVYIPYDSNDGWKIQLCKELRNAGLPIDEAKFASALIS